MVRDAANQAGWTYAELHAVSFVSVTSESFQTAATVRDSRMCRPVSLTKAGADNATCIAA